MLEGPVDLVPFGLDFQAVQFATPWLPRWLGLAVSRAAVASSFLLVGGCSPAGHPPPTADTAPVLGMPGPTTERSPDTSLELIGFDVIRTGERNGEFEIGGLSGCAYEPRTSLLHCISDERKEALIFSFNLELGMGFRVRSASVLRLRPPPGRQWRDDIFDGEGLALLGDRWVLTTEGDREGAVGGAFEFTRAGVLSEVLPIPDTFRADRYGSGQRHGLRENNGFESLTRSGDALLTGSESPLAQDDGDPAIGRGGWGRLLEWRESAGQWRAVRQFAYPLDPLPPDTALQDAEGSSGLVDLVTMGPGRLLALERGFVRDRAAPPDQARFTSYNVIRVYDVLLDEASDVSALDSLKSRPAPRPARKRLVLDLADLKDRLPPQLARLENFEAMCFGPEFPGGGRSVLLVSDNNFNPGQRTVFLMFRLETLIRSDSTRIALPEHAGLTRLRSPQQALDLGDLVRGQPDRISCGPRPWTRSPTQMGHAPKPR